MDYRESIIGNRESEVGSRMSKIEYRESGIEGRRSKGGSRESRVEKNRLPPVALACLKKYLNGFLIIAWKSRNGLYISKIDVNVK